MLPGPNQIVACPHCEALAQYETLTSGNTFGVRVWTDGKQVAPMLPQPPAVAKCRHCEECYWLADAREVGTLELWGNASNQSDPTWRAAPKVEEPSETDFYAALNKGLATDDQQELELRILAWWRRNDVCRDDVRGARQTTLTEEGRRNLDELVRLLDEGDESDLIMKAEALRELGEFKAAGEILDRVTSEEYAAVVRQLRQLCDDRDPCVKELQFDG